MCPVQLRLKEFNKIEGHVLLKEVVVPDEITAFLPLDGLMGGEVAYATASTETGFLGLSPKAVLTVSFPGEPRKVIKGAIPTFENRLEGPSYQTMYETDELGAEPEVRRTYILEAEYVADYLEANHFRTVHGERG